MSTSGGNSNKGNAESRFTKNESEWEVDDIDEDSDTSDEYNHDVRNAFNVLRWVNVNILVFSLYRVLYIL